MGREASAAVRWTFLCVLLGCGTSKGDLLVHLRTDFVPGVEFTAVRTERFDQSPAVSDSAPASDTRTQAVFSADDFVAGQRIASFLRIGRREHAVRVRLLDSDGQTVIERVVLTRVEGASLITVVVTRDCRGVACPGTADDPGAVACLGGRCVDPSCSPEHPDLCPAPACGEAADCPAPAADCAATACLDGVCLVRETPGACGASEFCEPEVGCRPLPGFDRDAGLIDAGSDAGAGDAGRDDAGAGDAGSDAGRDDAGAGDAGSDAGTTGACFGAGFTRRMTLTFDNSAQGADLVDFPVLVVLDSTRIDYAMTRDQGEDIRFTSTSDSTVALPHEIEQWDETGRSFVWVRVPRIAARSTTDAIWLHYGNASAPDAQDAGATWDNYGGVWHLGEDPSTAGPLGIRDSSPNANHGTSSGAMGAEASVPGPIGRALLFDGVDDLIMLGDPSDDSLDFGTSSFSYSAWVEIDTSAGPYDMIWWKGGSSESYVGYLLETGTTDWCMSMTDVNAVAGRSVFGPEASFLGRWVYLVAVVDRENGMLRTYADGLRMMAQPIGGLGSLSTDVAASIGGRGPMDNAVHGTIDEMRVVGAALSDDDVRAQHLSMLDRLITYGPAEACL